MISKTLESIYMKKFQGWQSIYTDKYIKDSQKDHEVSLNLMDKYLSVGLSGEVSFSPREPLMLSEQKGTNPLNGDPKYLDLKGDQWRKDEFWYRDKYGFFYRYYRDEIYYEDQDHFIWTPDNSNTDLHNIDRSADIFPDYVPPEPGDPDYIISTSLEKTITFWRTRDPSKIVRAWDFYLPRAKLTIYYDHEKKIWRDIMSHPYHWYWLLICLPKLDYSINLNSIAMGKNLSSKLEKCDSTGLDHQGFRYYVKSSVRYYLEDRGNSKQRIWYRDNRENFYTKDKNGTHYYIDDYYDYLRWFRNPQGIYYLDINYRNINDEDGITQRVFLDDSYNPHYIYEDLKIYVSPLELEYLSYDYLSIQCHHLGFRLVFDLFRKVNSTDDEFPSNPPESSRDLIKIFKVYSNFNHILQGYSLEDFNGVLFKVWTRLKENAKEKLDLYPENQWTQLVELSFLKIVYGLRFIHPIEVDISLIKDFSLEELERSIYLTYSKFVRDLILISNNEHRVRCAKDRSNYLSFKDRY